MTSQSNTFRLQRLTKTIGTRDHSQSQYEPKQTFKLAAINSISRSVKYNDLSYVSGRDLNKLRKEPEAGEDILYDNAHVNLADIRKNYDSAHKEKGTRELSISKLKQQKIKLSIGEKLLLDNKQTGEKEVKDLHTNLQNIKLLFTEADMQKKVLLNMRLRLKTDKVVYDQRKFDMEKQLKFLKKQKEVIIIDKTDLTESDDRTTKIQKKFLNQLKAQQEEREQHLQNLQAMIQQKQRANQLNEFREREIQQIAERAMQDKDDNEKNWEKLYLANKLLSKLLRTKMDRQMNKFFTVESAFKTIKIATGVNDAETLVQKFLNKQIAYGDLLGKIAQNQKRILVLKEQRKDLNKQFKELESEKEVIDSTKRTAQNVEKQLKKLGEIDHKEQKSFIYREKIRAWIVKNNKKMNSILGKSFSTSVDRSIKDISKSFIEYLKNISSELDNLKDKQVQQDTKPSTPSTNNFRKNIRIRQEKEEEEEDDGDNFEQADMVTAQRLDLLKSNDKFMKEVKRKFEEKRKAAAEAASPKKKQPEKVPVKKPQDD